MCGSKDFYMDGTTSVIRFLYFKFILDYFRIFFIFFIYSKFRDKYCNGILKNTAKFIKVPNMIMVTNSLSDLIETEVPKNITIENFFSFRNDTIFG